MAEIRPFQTYRCDSNRVALKDVLTQSHDKITPQDSNFKFELGNFI
jgi:hypothetical protein